MPPEKIDSLSDDVKPLVLALVRQIAELSARIDQLLARNAELEARLGLPKKTPDNSSLPPSSGQKANRPAPDRKPRKGRPGVARALCAEPDEVREVRPERCGACGAPSRAGDESLAHAYDHIDLPPIRPITTRINLWRCRCSCCGHSTTAKAPGGLAPGSPFGPGIAALVIYLHARQLMSYARLAEALRDVFGLTISQGAIANIIARAGKPFAAAREKIEAEVRAAPVIHCDETSARVEGKTHWQWLFGSVKAVVHRIAPSRGKAVIDGFLGGARPEVWVSDRLPAQGGHAARHQYCLAHLIRDAQYAIDTGDHVFAPAFKALLKDACAMARRRERLADTTLASYAARLERRLTQVLRLPPMTAEGVKLRATMRDHRQKLFVFMRRRDVPSTNNVSERGLRPSVIFRKVTCGFRSAWGAQAYADICSVMATALLHGRTALGALRNCLAGVDPIPAG